MLTINKFSGTANKFGYAYTKKYKAHIAGFFSQEFSSYSYSLKYIRACYDIMLEAAPIAAAFLRGAAQESYLSLEQHTLLMLHEEELYHRNLKKKAPHCSAVGIVSHLNKSNSTIVGQNWDWNTRYFPWSSINKIALSGYPRIAALSYPGLPTCAGVNSSGLSLMWTGAGYYPPIKPKIGVPTYALVFETLLRRDVKEAVNYLRKAKNAGAFIFFLGDSQGNLAIVEGVPGKIFIEFCKQGHRANLFQNPAAIAAANQRTPREAKCHSVIRQRIFRKCANELGKMPNIKGVKEILSQPDILIKQSYSHATLVQLIADSQSAKLHARFWGDIHKQWHTIEV